MKKNELTFEKVWLMFQETDKKFQELTERFRETDERFKETAERFKQTDEKFKQTDERFKQTDERFKQTDEKFKQTDEKFKQTDERFKEFEEKWDRIFEESRKEFQKRVEENRREIREIKALFTDEIGEIVEALVESPLVKLFNERGIQVKQTYQRALSRRTGRDVEVDIIAEDGMEVIVVEVKTTLRKRDIDKFIEKLKIFKEAFPKYKENHVYGAIAYLNGRTELTKYAYKKGLFVIKVINENAKILNDEKFRPLTF